MIFCPDRNEVFSSQVLNFLELKLFKNENLMNDVGEPIGPFCSIMTIIDQFYTINECCTGLTCRNMKLEDTSLDL